MAFHTNGLCDSCWNPVNEGIPEKFGAMGEISYVGSGSVSRVYKITGLREYALKVIDCEDRYSRLEHALYEIRVMEALADCPHVVRILDHEIVREGENGKVFLLEEFCTPLKSYLSENIISYSKRVSMAVQICDALIECREAGVLHLDIQPGNLFVDSQGRIKLGDFSASLFISDLPENDSMRGTLEYMAPEVFSKHLCSEQSDIYSVGMILYRLLDDIKLSRRSRELAIFKRLAGLELQDITACSPVLSGAFMPVLRQICAFDPKERVRNFEGLKTLLLQLEETVSGIETDADIQSLICVDPIVVSVAQSVASVSVSNVMRSMGEPGQTVSLRRYRNVPPGNSALPPCPTYIKIDTDGASNQKMTNASAIELPAWDTFGDEIGDLVPKSALETPKEQEKVCRLCGKPLFPPYRFCANCGSDQQPPKPTVNLHQVEFSAIAPRAFVRGRYAMVNIVMYEQAFRDIVETIKTEKQEPVQEVRGGVMKVAENASVRVHLSSPDLEISTDTQTAVWGGSYLNFGFAVCLPKHCRKSEILISAAVYINDVIATRLEMTAKRVSIWKQMLRIRREDVYRGFVSYASQDRDKVAMVAVGLKSARPDMQLFMDVESLRTGEDWENAITREIIGSSTFFLCWSKHAKESAYVEKEWRCAYRHKGAAFIEPIPLEEPVSKPPRELEKKHFNSKYLYFIKKEEESIIETPSTPSSIVIGI